MKRIVLALVTLLSPAASFAKDLSAQDVGRIQYAEDQARAKVDAKYKGKDLTRMNAEDRRAYQAEQNAAVQAVHNENGVTEKDVARRTARMSPGESAAAKEAAREAQKDDLRREIQKEEEAKQAAAGIEVIPKDEAKRRMRQNERTVEVKPEDDKPAKDKKR